MTKTRLRYIDYIKGFAIIAMLFIHTMDTSQYPVGVWITSFDMPIFFVLAGVLIFHRSHKKAIGFKDTLLKRCKQLLIPYFVFCLILCAFYSCLNYIGGEELNLQYYLFRTFTLQGVESLWFIPCFFVSELLLVLSIKNRISKVISAGIVILIVALTSVFNIATIDFWLVRVLLKFAVSYAFVFVGYIVASLKIPNNLPVFILSVLCCIASFPLSQLNGSVGIGGLDLGKAWLFYILGIINSVSFIGAFRFIDSHIRRDLRFLTFFGINSIVCLCTNNLLVESIRLLDYKLFNNKLINLGFVGCIVFLLILVLLEIPIIMLSKTKIGIIFGKIK